MSCSQPLATSSVKALTHLAIYATTCVLMSMDLPPTCSAGFWMTLMFFPRRLRLPPDVLFENALIRPDRHGFNEVSSAQ